MERIDQSVLIRVRGLPEQNGLQLLQTTIDQNLTSEEQSTAKYKVDVLSSCTSHDCVGLVEFLHSAPAFLDSLVQDPLREWQVEIAGVDLTFDRHFLGFTQLYNTKDSETITMDVIAITGLDGHAFDSWRGRNNLGRMWLRDFLSSDLPRCRTMTYGYNAKLLSPNISTLLEYGRELLESIKFVRRTAEERNRPLVFVAHGVGGIVVSHALIKSSQRYQQRGSATATTYSATYGILFFGTPHRGLCVGDLQGMLAAKKDHPRHQFLQQIEERSHVLSAQLDDFVNILGHRKIVSFYETQQTNSMAWNRTKCCWEREGDPVTVVRRESAVLHLPKTTETAIPINANHDNMVRFDDRYSFSYKNVIHKLEEFEKEAPASVSTRLAIDTEPGSLETGRAHVFETLGPIYTSGLPQARNPRVPQSVLQISASNQP